MSMSGLMSWLASPEAWIGGLGVLACIGLFALLRGAIREGERWEGSGPRAGYRDAMVAAAIGGQAFVGLAAVVAVSGSIPWSIPLFALGLGGLLTVIRVNRRYRHDSPTLRRVVQIANVALSGSLLAGVLVVGNVIAFRYADRPFDFTRDRAFSLSSLTIGQLRELDRPLEFTVFYGNSPVAVRQRTRVTQLLELYRAINPRWVHIQEAARYADPVGFEELVRRMPDVGVAPGGGVLIELGEGDAAKRAVARFGELFEAEPGAGPDQFAARFLGEDVLTSTLIRLREDKPLILAFTTGHGEPGVLDIQDPAGLGLFRSRLASYGAAAGTISLVRDPVPADVDVLFVVRPRAPFEPREVERLQEYISRGGRAVLLLDARQRTGLEDWLGTFRIGIGAASITDARFNLGRADLPVAPVTGTNPHPIVAPLVNRIVFIPGAAPMTITTAGTPGQALPDPRWQARPILRTSPDARIARVGSEQESDSTPAAPGAPFIVGMAVTEIETNAAKGRSETPRIVVFSSPHLADNQVAQADPTNPDLLVNAIGWLRGRPALAGIAPTTHVARTLDADPNLRARLVLLPTLLAVSLIVGLGLFVYLARRH